MHRDTTLSQAVWRDNGLLRGAAMVLGGSVFVALAAQISIPFWPVPMTLQVLAVLLVGFTFGARLGAATLLVYLAQGAAGLPVFANGGGGLVYLSGPTLGFLLGFVAMAWAAGWAAERGIARGFFGTSLTGLVLSAALYLPGVAWPMGLAAAIGLDAGWAGQGWGYYWQYFVGPYLLGDALKAVIAALVVTGGWAALARR
ncbi:MAG: biotin transporter BioY [Pseudomonadota bacterium]